MAIPQARTPAALRRKGGRVVAIRKGIYATVCRASSDFAADLIGELVYVVDTSDGKDGEHMAAIHRRPWPAARWIHEADLEPALAPDDGPQRFLLSHYAPRPPRRQPRRTCVDDYIAHCVETGNGDLVKKCRQCGGIMRNVHPMAVHCSRRCKTLRLNAKVRAQKQKRPGGPERRR